MILSQADASGVGLAWLGADAATGALMTAVTDGGRFTTPLVSEVNVTDGAWRRIRLVWDGARRYLYVDGQEAIADTRDLGKLLFSNEGFYLGAGEGFAPGTFFAGLVDEVRFYNVALRLAQVPTEAPSDSD